MLDSGLRGTPDQLVLSSTVEAFFTRYGRT